MGKQVIKIFFYMGLNLFYTFLHLEFRDDNHKNDIKHPLRPPQKMKVKIKNII